MTTTPNTTYSHKNNIKNNKDNDSNNQEKSLFSREGYEKHQVYYYSSNDEIVDNRETTKLRTNKIITILVIK